jgi:hypothetical protein
MPLITRQHIQQKISSVHPKYYRIAGIVAGVLLLILLIGGYIAYSKREAILQHELTKAINTAKTKYHLDLKFGSAKFVGLSTVEFKNITVVPEGKDSLLRIGQFDVGVKILPLIFGKVKLADVVLQNGRLNLTNLNGVRNFDFLFKHKSDSTETGSKSNLADLANNLVNQVLYKIPDNLNLRNFLVTYLSDSTKAKVWAQSAIIDGGKLTSTIVVNDTLATWHFNGDIHPGDKAINITMTADGKPVQVPFIPAKYKAKVSFDSFTARLTGATESRGETQINGSWAVHNLVINQPALASNDIVVQDASIDANMVVGENYLALDSSSTIHLKKITAHPFVKYTLRPNKIYELKLNTNWLNAQDIFDSFPRGIFDALDGIQVAGKLNYHFNFALDSSNPDDLQFDSRLDRDGFRVTKYGKTDLTKLNNTFIYTPYEKGKPMAPREIGPDNPYYTPIDQIAPDLRNAVMTAEDPTFYKNNGFVEETIRKSIATDFKTKKFKRGGSTISMQLVKNAFLSREKTLARKIEETLIVWMIVNNNIMTKNRMLEVYFNIIEWGPDVYGIGEASRFYFGKTPAELTLGESIYLASIVPKPKAGLYYFEPDGSLRPNLVNYFNLIGKLMAGQYLTKFDTSNAYGFYSVRLKEAIRSRVAHVDSAQANKIINAASQDDDNAGVTPYAAPVQDQQTQPAPAPGKPTFLQRLFGKKDTTATRLKQQLNDEEDLRIKNIDTAGKTKKQIRQEKRQIKDDIDAKRKALKDQGLL